MLEAKQKLSIRSMTKISLLSVIGFVVMLIEFPLGFFPEFLKLDLSDIPALIGSFAIGPVAGVIIQLIKNILHAFVKLAETGGVGQLANFMVGSVFVFTAGSIYARRKSFKTAILAMVVGTISMSLFAAIFNYLLFIPLYARYFGLPLEKYIDMAVDMAQKVNKLVVDYETLVLVSIVPFNLLKGVIVSLITLLLYKKISPYLR